MFKIAIDGPSGSGKSTLAKALAEKLQYLYIDTGAMYRTIGYYAKIHHIEPSDEETLSKHFEKIRISLDWIDGAQHIFLGSNDVTTLIRTPEMSMYASSVSALPSVRAFLLQKQRSFSLRHNVIMDGRDIGTVVLPDADVKIFLKANDETRAMRRYKELLEKGEKVIYNDVLADMRKRDENDATRATAPCVPASDAVLLDNTAMSLEETVDKVVRMVKEKHHENG